MADIRLDASDAREARVGGGAAEGLGQGGDLDRVAQIGAGAVAFDVVDGVGGHARDFQRLGHAGGLTFDRGGEVARLGRAVIVDGGAADDGPDVVAIGDGIFQTPQDDGPCARAEDGALTAVVEGMADTVG